MSENKTWWSLELAGKPDFESAMERVYAWYEGEMIDRPPVRFTRHNADFELADHGAARWPDLEARWFDAEHQVETFVASIEGKRFHGETFPVFWPNLGPSVYAAFYGAELEFGEVTSWIHHPVREPSDADRLRLDRSGRYFAQIEEMTRLALEGCQGKYMVGYTDLHPGMDCVSDWRGQEQLCYDLYDNPELIERLLVMATRDFQDVYDQFDGVLKAHDQLTVTWMGIPSFGKMHIPSCDFSCLLPEEMFDRYVLPALREEVKPMTHNIYHLDGKEASRHLDRLLEIPEINAIQWVQGVGEDQPIMQWVPLIKKVQAAGKGVVVDLTVDEFEGFMRAVPPEGLYLCIASDSEDEELEILRRVEKW